MSNEHNTATTLPVLTPRQIDRSLMSPAEREPHVRRAVEAFDLADLAERPLGNGEYEHAERIARRGVREFDWVVTTPGHAPVMASSLDLWATGWSVLDPTACG